MGDTWIIDDYVLLALEPLDAGADVGFVCASLQIRKDSAMAALERLESKGLLISGIVSSSGGKFRAWRVSANVDREVSQ